MLSCLCAGPEPQVQWGHLQLLSAHLPGPVLHLWDHMLSVQVSKKPLYAHLLARHCLSLQCKGSVCLLVA